MTSHRVRYQPRTASASTGKMARAEYNKTPEIVEKQPPRPREPVRPNFGRGCAELKLGPFPRAVEDFDARCSRSRPMPVTRWPGADRPIRDSASPSAPLPTLRRPWHSIRSNRTRSKASRRSNRRISERGATIRPGHSGNTKLNGIRNRLGHHFFTKHYNRDLMFIRSTYHNSIACDEYLNAAF